MAAIASGAAAGLTSATTQATAAPAHTISAGPSPRGTLVLDAFTKPLTADAPAASQINRAPRQIARSMLHSYGWTSRQFTYLNSLWSRESGWNPRAENPFSGAYGIPQADPGSKMASAGPNWRTNARTQIRWGLRYIKRVYGSPRHAWIHETASGWY